MQYTALATQLMATFFGVHGILMAPVGWTWALVVRGCAVVDGLLVNDRVKMVAYRIFDREERGLMGAHRD